MKRQANTQTGGIGEWKYYRQPHKWSKTASASQNEGRTHFAGNKHQCSITARKLKMSQSPSIKLLNEKLLPANYIADELIQRVIQLLKNYNKTGVTPCHHRGTKILFLSIDDRDFF